VLSYIKVTNFDKLAYIGILEDFRMLYYIKVTKFVKLDNFDILEDFFCVILHRSHEVR